MLIPIKWLQEYVTFNQRPKELGWVLTEIGLSLEAIHLIENEPVLELEITPNRPDWLSITGVAKEVAVIAGQPVNLPATKPITSRSRPLVKFTNDPVACPRYTAISVRKVTVKESPDWLQKKLIQVGLRPINNLVDISNFVMFELGNPIHFFDQDQIAGPEIRMRRARRGERFTSVDELSYDLPEGAVVIEDREKIIDLCGIKGGLNTAITTQTKNIFIHVPIYDPVLIRRTATALDLHPEAAMIYERGADPGGTLTALARAVELTQELAGGEVAGGLIDEKQKEFRPWQINLDLTHLDRILGVKLNQTRVITILDHLGLKPQLKGKTITCTIPTSRADLKIPEDLIEEVARHYGYNRLPKQLVVGEINLKPIPYAWDDSFENKVKNLLVAAGFTEVMTYTLLSGEEITAVNYDPEEILKLINPVSNQYQYLQPSLIPSLLAAVKTNLPLKSEISLFELGHVFTGKDISNPKEKIQLGMIKLGDEYLTLKGLIELFQPRLGIKIEFKPAKPIPNSWYHPARSAIIQAENHRLGLIGEIHPHVLSQFGIDLLPVVFATIDYETLAKFAKPYRSFTPPPNYPAFSEDLTVVLPPKSLVGKVINSILGTSKLIVKTELVDQYQNAFTFRITYQDWKKTLSGKEISRIREKIIHKLERQVGGKVKRANP